MMYEVMIADKEKKMIDSISSIITQDHPEIIITEISFKGDELFQMIQDKQPDLVITDIVLSGMNGLKVISEIRKLKLPIRFLIVSAETRFEYIRSALLLGADDFLPKPLQAGELQKSMIHVLKKIDTASPSQKVYASSKSFLPSYSLAVQKTKTFIDRHYSEHLSVQYVASKISLNATYLGHLFKKEVGISFKDYVTQQRIEAAKRLLFQGYSTVEAAAAVGYQDVKYFRKVFQKRGCPKTMID